MSPERIQQLERQIAECERLLATSLATNGIVTAKLNQLADKYESALRWLSPATYAEAIKACRQAR